MIRLHRALYPVGAFGIGYSTLLDYLNERIIKVYEHDPFFQKLGDVLPGILLVTGSALLAYAAATDIVTAINNRKHERIL